MVADSEERCELSDLPVSMCSHCRGLDADRPGHRMVDSDPVHVGIWITARFAGRCPVCERWYAEGEHIGKPDADYDLDGWVCQDCGYS